MRKLLVALTVLTSLVIAPMAQAKPATFGFEMTIRDFAVESTCGGAIGASEVWLELSFSAKVTDKSSGDVVDRRQQTTISRTWTDENGNYLGSDSSQVTETLTGLASDPSTNLRVQTGRFFHLRSATGGQPLIWSGSVALDSTGIIWFHGRGDPSELLTTPYAQVACSVLAG